MKNIKTSIVTFLSLMLLVSCGGTKQDAKTSTNSSSSGKALVIATDVDLSSMDHNLATDQMSLTAINLGISGLMEKDADGNLVNDLAEKYEVSEDGLTYTFYLKDANWSNGTPVTAKDFVFGWQRQINPETGGEYAFLFETMNVLNADKITTGELPIQEFGVEAVDDKTFKVSLSAPCGFFMDLMAFPSLFPLNEEFYKSQGEQYATAPDKLIYNGPFVLDSWTQGNGFSFRKNESYYNAESIKQEKIEYKYIQDIQSAMLEYQSGNLDVVKLSGEMVDAYKNDSGFTQRLMGYVWYLSLNHKLESLSNANLRKAIALSIDRETIANNVLKDGSIEANGIIPSKFTKGINGKDYREEVEDLTSYNPEEAQKYYDLAKEELGKDVTITLLFEDSEASKSVAEYIQNNLETNLKGIKINLDSKPKKTRLQLMSKGEFEIGLTRWGPDYADPQTYMELFVSDSGMNHGKYSSNKYDELIEKSTVGENSKDSVKRLEGFIEAEKTLVLDDNGIVPLYQNGGAIMINPNVEGLIFVTTGVDNIRHATVK